MKEWHRKIPNKIQIDTENNMQRIIQNKIQMDTEKDSQRFRKKQRNILKKIDTNISRELDIFNIT